MKRFTLSEHLLLEVAASHRRGRPLGPDEPVPGCACLLCLTLAAGGTPHDAEVAELAIRRLALVALNERFREADIIRGKFLAAGVVLPSAMVLARRAARVPGALRDEPREELPRLPVEAARQVSILDVAERLGLGQPVRRGREYVVCCPFHDDNRPSLRLSMERGLWYCDVCAEGGDAIDLWQRARSVEFPEAVKELADGLTAATAGQSGWML